MSRGELVRRRGLEARRDLELGPSQRPLPGCQDDRAALADPHPHLSGDAVAAARADLPLRAIVLPLHGGLHRNSRCAARQLSSAFAGCSAATHFHPGGYDPPPLGPAGSQRRASHDTWKPRTGKLEVREWTEAAPYVSSCWASPGVFIFMAMMNKLNGGGSSTERQPLGGESASSSRPSARFRNSSATSGRARSTPRLRSHGGTLTKFELTTAKYMCARACPSMCRRRRIWRASTRVSASSSSRASAGTARTIRRHRGTSSSTRSISTLLEQVRRKVVRVLVQGREGRAPRASFRRPVNRTSSRSTRLVKNVATAPMRHEMSVDTVAWRTRPGGPGEDVPRQAPFVTHVECTMPQTGKAVRLLPSELRAEGLPRKIRSRRASELNPRGEWYRAPGTTAFAAVTNAYFASAIVPLAGRRAGDVSAPGRRAALGLHRRYTKPSDDPNSGAMYRASPRVSTQGASARTW